MSRYFEERIHRTLTTVSLKTLQIRISSLPDRDLAMALEALHPEDAGQILSLLPPAKIRRVVQEREYLERLRFTSAQLIAMAERLADAMDGHRGDSRRMWIAPPSGKR